MLTMRQKGMTDSQVKLVEHALRQITRLSESGWEEIPSDLHPAFKRYMARDVWTGESDVLTLRDAALMIVRDAITRTGDFADED